MCVCAGRRCGTPGCRGRALEPVLSEAAGVDWRRFRLQARCVVAVLLCAARPIRAAGGVAGGSGLSFHGLFPWGPMTVLIPLLGSLGG